MVKLPTDKRDALLAFLGLPLLLFVLTWVLAGCYYETNDDQIITLMLRGVSIQPALTDLSIYFFGFSQLLAWLYAILPGWPWYGLLLYTGLLVATGLACWLLLRHFALLKPWHRWALLTAFYVFCWLEHVMWFNYMRVPLLLAGTSFLFFVCRQLPATPFRWGPALLSGGLFLSALCIRPSAALLGLLVVAPAAFLLPAGRRQAWVPLLFFGLLAGSFLLWLQVHQSPAARQYQRLDLWKSAVLDYGIYEPQLHTPADSLAYAAIGHWLLADSQVINDDFFRRQGQVHAAYVAKQAPQKGRVLLEALGRDQFFILLLAAGLLAWRRQAPQPARKRLLAYGGYVALLLLAIGLLLKLPPRVLSPCLSLFVLVLLVTIPWPLVRLPAQHTWRLAVLLLALAGLAYLAKAGHRARFQRQRQQAHEQVLDEVARLSRGRSLVYSALPDYFRSLSPFRNYAFGAQVLIPLTGWSTADPAYRHFYRRQTGQDTFAGTVEALARQPATLWLLEPEFAVFLSRYMQVLHGVPLGLREQTCFPLHPGLVLYAPVLK